MPFRSCPHLGLREDITAHVDYPSYDNFCYLSGERQIVSMADQARFCLNAQYMACPRLAAQNRGVPTGQALPPRPRPEVKKAISAANSGWPASFQLARSRPAPPAMKPSPAPPKPPLESYCPHLGSLNNPETHAQYPSYHNFCYVSGKRRVVSMSDQGRLCLTAAYRDCVRLKASPPPAPRPQAVEEAARVREAVPEPAREVPEVRPARKAPPIDLVALANLAIQGKFAETIAAAEQATEGLDSNAAKSLVWGLLVSSYSEATGDLVSDFVFSCWKRALELDPASFRPYYGLAFYYAGHGDYPNALWAASQVLKLAPKDDPTYKGIWQFIGMAEQKLGTEKVEKYLKQG